MKMREHLQELARRIGPQVSDRVDGIAPNFVRNVEHVMAETYDKKYPELPMASGDIIPFKPIPTGSVTYSYTTFGGTGFAAILNSYSKDSLPDVGIEGQKTTGNIVAVGNRYGFSIQDIRTSEMAGTPLETEKSDAARRAHDQVHNTLGWFGSPRDQLHGLLTHPNITMIRAPLNGGSTSRTWALKTFQEILADVRLMLTTVQTTTNSAHTLTTLVLPADIYTDIKVRNINDSNSSNASILQYLESATGLMIKGANELSAANHASVAEYAGVNVAVAFASNAAKLVIAQPFEQFPPQQDGLRIDVPCHSRCGGVMVPYPLAVCVLREL